ncbi:MAG: hypothetical protein DRN71_03015, partial [Candidatus Nanohalarchaeota archaeon]
MVSASGFFEELQNIMGFVIGGDGYPDTQAMCASPHTLEVYDSCKYVSAVGREYYIKYTSWSNDNKSVIEVNGVTYIKSVGGFITLEYTDPESEQLIVVGMSNDEHPKLTISFSGANGAAGEYSQFSSNTIIVYGAHTPPLDYTYCLGELKAKWPNHIIKQDSDVTAADKETKNLILLSGPASNRLVGDLASAGKTLTVAEWMENYQSDYIAHIVKDAYVSGKDALIIAGWDVEQSKNACDHFLENKPPTVIDKNKKCTDSDGGRNYYVKGECLVCTQSGNSGGCRSVSDYCVDKKQLKEAYCQGNDVESTIHTCSNGCEDGICRRVCAEGATGFPMTGAVTVDGNDYSVHSLSGDLQITLVNTVGKDVIVETIQCNDGVSVRVSDRDGFLSTGQSRTMTVSSCVRNPGSESTCYSIPVVITYGVPGGLRFRSAGVLNGGFTGVSDSPEVVDPCDLPGTALNTESECEAAGCDWLPRTHGCGNTGAWSIDNCGYELHDYECSIKASRSRKWDGAVSECYNCDCSWCCCPAFDNDHTAEKCIIGRYNCEKDSSGKYTGWSQKCYDESKGWVNVVYCDNGCNKDTGQCNSKEEDTGICGDGTCEDKEEGICPQDCMQVYPSGSDVEYCKNNRGVKSPTQGEGAATWFLWNGCSKYKEYEVVPETKLRFLITGDSCSGCVCYSPNFKIYEYDDSIGGWTMTKQYSPKGYRGYRDNLYYVPQSSKIKVEASRCFYLRVYYRYKQDFPSVCSDGVCASGESIASCPKDCTNFRCIEEGESMPAISNRFQCCGSLKLIKPRSRSVTGSSGICTARCGNGACDSDVETDYNCPEDCKAMDASCTDSDGGKNYHVKGTVKNTKYGKTDVDSCKSNRGDDGVKVDNGPILDEYYCIDGVTSVSEYTCPNGCKDGACISSKDTWIKQDDCHYTLNKETLGFLEHADYTKTSCYPREHIHNKVLFDTGSAVSKKDETYRTKLDLNFDNQVTLPVNKKIKYIYALAGGNTGNVYLDTRKY